MAGAGSRGKGGKAGGSGGGGATKKAGGGGLPAEVEAALKGRDDAVALRANYATKTAEEKAFISKTIAQIQSTSRPQMSKDMAVGNLLGGMLGGNTNQSQTGAGVARRQQRQKELVKSGMSSRDASFITGIS